MSLFSRFLCKPQPDQAGAANDWRKSAATRLESLLQSVARKDFANEELNHLESLLESSSPNTMETSLATIHLHKAQRFLRSNEVGSAVYELRLLLGCLLCA